MPEYTYFCNNCDSTFSIICSIKEYRDQHLCSCGKRAFRSYIDDLITLNTSVKKSDNELKTIGDLAKRNSERMSDDQKLSLYQKHNSYREDKDLSQLPSGMSRVDKKIPKIKWPGTSGIKNKRKPKNGK